VIRYKTISITTSSTGVSLTDALISIGDRKRVIKNLRFTLIRNPCATAAVESIPKALAYLDTDQILEGNFGSFSSGQYSSVDCLYGEAMFKMDMPISAGQKFQIGANVTTANDSILCTVEYEDQ
jgi:hypothetical protein